MNNNFKCLMLYGAFFARRFDLGDLDSFAGNFQTRFVEFSQPPLKPVLPPEPSPEMPRLILLNSQQTQGFEVGMTKIAYRTSAQQPRDFQEFFNEYLKKFMLIQAFLSENYSFKTIRIGFMVTIFSHLGESANQKLVDYFFQNNELLGHPLHELQIHALTKPMLKGNIPVNRWLRIKPLRTSDPRHLDTGLSIEVDINTLPEYGHDRSTKEINDFFIGSEDYIKHQVPILSDSSFFENENREIE